MKKLLIAAVALCVASPALAEDWDFVLTNNTGKKITKVELSPAGAGSWKENIVDPELVRADSLAPGGRTTIRFDKDDDKCRYDVRLTLDGGTVAIWSNINVCDNAYVTVDFKNDTPTFKAN